MTHALHKTFLATVLSMFAVVANAHDFAVDGVYYNITSSEELTVEVTYEGSSYSHSKEYTGDVNIPTSVEYKEISYTVTSIGEFAFRDCPSLTGVVISNSVTEIGEIAFQGCSSLTSVTIPCSVTSIGGLAFEGCTTITSLTCKATIPPTCHADVFYNVDKDSCILHVPTGTISFYQAASQWKEFYNIIDDASTGIGTPTTDANVKEMSRYNMNGQRTEGAQRGVNIIRMSDDSTKKVIVK